MRARPRPHSAWSMSPSPISAPCMIRFLILRGVVHSFRSVGAQPCVHIGERRFRDRITPRESANAKCATRRDTGAFEEIGDFGITKVPVSWSFGPGTAVSGFTALSSLARFAADRGDRPGRMSGP